MIRLDTTTRSLQVLLSGAITTNQLQVVTCWSDKTSTTYTGGSTVVNTNSATPVTIVAAPGASTIRDIDSISVYNKDTVPATVTIQYNDNSTIYIIGVTVLQSGDHLIYAHGNGWTVLDNQGNLQGVSSFTAGTTNLGGLLTWVISQDQEKISLDTSPFRLGSNSLLTSGSMYTLVGDTVMWYWTHNTAVDASGNFLGRDDTGPCTFWAYTESGLLVTYNANTASAGTVPTWNLIQSTDTNTGAFTIATQGSTTPAAPPANTVTIFGRQIAGRSYAAAIGPAGLDYSFQPNLARNKVGYWNPPGNATTTPGIFGFTAPTTAGSVQSRTVATTNVLTRMRRLGYQTTATTSGLLAQQYVAVAQFTTGDGSGNGGFTMIARFGQANVNGGMRFFCGMTSNTGAATDVSPDTLTNAIGVGMLSTDLSQWYFCYGGSAAQTAIALGAGLGAPNSTTTAYELAIFCSPNANGVVGYQVTNLGTGTTVSGTITPGTPGTQTPANTTLLAFRIWTTNHNTGGLVGYDLCSCYIETDN